jgi:hypothetical protein
MSKQSVSFIPAVLIAACLVILLLIFNLKNSSQSRYSLKALTSAENNSDESELTSDYHLTKPDPYKLNVIDNHTDWIFNENILQYGTIFSLTKLHEYEIEVMIASLNTQAFPVNHTLRCLIELNQRLAIIKPVIEILYLETLRVKCYLSEEEYRKVRDNRIFVAVFDTRDNFSDTLNVVHGREAAFYDHNTPKIKGLKNCACAVRNLSEQVYEDALVWTRLHKAIGVGELSIYTTDLASQYGARLAKAFPGYLTVHPYDMNVRRLCERYTATARSAVEKCVSRTRAFFEPGAFNYHHQELMMSHCLFVSKHKYQFLTSYDIDEIIFPRKFGKSFFASAAAAGNGSRLRVCDRKHKLAYEPFHIYDYIQWLITIYGHSITTFWFDNHIFLKKTDEAFRAILKRPRVVGFNYSSVRINGDIRPTDVRHFELLKQANELTECLTERRLSRAMKSSATKWKSTFTCFYRSGGKSLHNTDHVRTIIHHFAWRWRAGTRHVSVAHEHGFLCHFRDEDYAYERPQHAFIQNFNDWMLDLEFVYFFLSVFGK